MFHLIGSCCRYNREFKKLRRQLQGKRHIKIELCVKLSLLRLFHVDHVVQNRRSALSLAGHRWFSSKDKEWKIYSCELALSSEPQIWKFHVVVWQTTSKQCTKKRAARAARLFFFIQLTIQIIDLWRCRWRCRRQILNSPMRVTRTGSHIYVISTHVDQNHATEKELPPLLKSIWNTVYGSVKNREV